MTALYDFFTTGNIKRGIEQLIWNEKLRDKISQQAPNGIIFNLYLSSYFFPLSFIEGREKSTKWKNSNISIGMIVAKEFIMDQKKCMFKKQGG